VRPRLREARRISARKWLWASPERVIVEIFRDGQKMEIVAALGNTESATQAR
jgi:hypothetical protein